MPKVKKMGRPKLPKGHAKGRIVPVRFSDEELKAMTKCADKSEHKTAAELMVAALSAHCLMGLSARIDN
jgi:hypothetical protein